MAWPEVWTQVGVRVRRLVVGRPALYWGVVGLIALAGAAGVQARVEGIESARQNWELTTPVLVSRGELEPGRALTADAVELVSLPRAAVPAGAVGELPEGLVAVDRLAAGEVVLAHHTTIGTGPGALLPAGSHGVSVPMADTALPLAPGDHVAVFVVADPLGSTSDQAIATGLLSESAEVIRLGEGAVVLAVPESQAAPVALAAAAGRTVLVLLRSPAGAAGPTATGG